MNENIKAAYKKTVNAIAVSLALSIALLGVLAFLLAPLKSFCKEALGEEWAELLTALLECGIYFVGFLIPARLLGYFGTSSDLPKDEKEKPSLLWIAAVSCLSLALIILASYANYFIVQSFSDYGDITQQSFGIRYLDKPHMMLLYLVSSALVPAVCEELLFRGAVCRLLAKYGNCCAIVISALIFALFHTNIAQILYTFAAGLLIGAIYLRTRSILCAMLLHFANNALSAVKTILSYNGMGSAVLFIDAAILLIGVCAALCLMIIYSKNKKVCDRSNEHECAQDMTKKEKTLGFFTPAMTLYVAYCVFAAVWYFCVSI